jgi:hypothetical protein
MIRKDLFWLLQFWRFLVPDRLALLLWDLLRGFMAETCGKAKLSTSWPGCESKEEEGLVSHYPSRGHVPVT